MFLHGCPDNLLFYPLVWGYGLVSVTLISLTSLGGVATIPFIGKKLYKKVLDMLVGLAVGSLAADSLLHLLPHVSTFSQILKRSEVCRILHCKIKLCGIDKISTSSRSKVWQLSSPCRI